MEEYLFTFRTITAAQSGEFELRRQGIPCRLGRTPRTLAVSGCGYCLRVRPQHSGVAAAALKTSKIEKQFHRLADGALEEVVL